LKLSQSKGPWDKSRSWCTCKNDSITQKWGKNHYLRTRRRKERTGLSQFSNEKYHSFLGCWLVVVVHRKEK
jgi:hypothetical protein